MMLWACDVSVKVVGQVKAGIQTVVWEQGCGNADNVAAPHETGTGIMEECANKVDCMGGSGQQPTVGVASAEASDRFSDVLIISGPSPNTLSDSSFLTPYSDPPTPFPTPRLPLLFSRLPTSAHQPLRARPTSSLVPKRHTRQSLRWLGAAFRSRAGGAPSEPVASAECQRRDVTAHHHVITALDGAVRRHACILDTEASGGSAHRGRRCHGRMMSTALCRVAQL